MSEKRKKREIEETLEGGRIYGTIARTEPEIWAWIEREEQLTGRKKHDILSEAIARMIIEREVVQRGLTMEQMLAAWDVKERVEQMLVRKMLTMGTSIFGQLLTSVGELVTGIRQYQDEKLQEIVEQEKRRDIEYQYKRTQAELAGKLMQTMMPIIMATLSQIKMPGIQIPQTQQEQKHEGIEVEVIE